jgi:hypothetical protein
VVDGDAVDLGNTGSGYYPVSTVPQEPQG